MMRKAAGLAGVVVAGLLAAACGSGTGEGLDGAAGAAGGAGGGGAGGGGGGGGGGSTTLVVRSAVLDSAQEVPPPAVVSTGTGKGAIVVDVATREVRGGVTLTGLAGTATAVHVRRAVPGVSGTVAEIDLVLVGDGAVIPEGTVFTQPQYDALLAGELYFHVNTTANTGGELRGQLMGQGGTVAATATLGGAQEVPPVTTAAGGRGVLVVDSASRSIIVAGETMSGVTPTATQIQQAGPGANGGNVVALDYAAGPALGTHVATAPHGAAPLTPAQHNALLAGELYFNVHSFAHPAGEIRGQLAVQPQTAAGLVPTLASIQANVFTSSCAFSGCHGSAGTQANLNLTAGASYANLVGVASSQNGAFTRVIAGNPNDSLLVKKLEQASPPVGQRMPQGGPYLPQATINVIRQWIQLGAPNS